MSSIISPSGSVMNPLAGPAGIVCGVPAWVASRPRRRLEARWPRRPGVPVAGRRDHRERRAATAERVVWEAGRDEGVTARSRRRERMLPSRSTDLHLEDQGAPGALCCSSCSARTRGRSVLLARAAAAARSLCDATMRRPWSRIGVLRVRSWSTVGLAASFQRVPLPRGSGPAHPGRKMPAVSR
jgi:hypothetical protein